MYSGRTEKWAGSCQQPGRRLEKKARARWSVYGIIKTKEWVGEQLLLLWENEKRHHCLWVVYSSHTQSINDRTKTASSTVDGLQNCNKPYSLGARCGSCRGSKCIHQTLVCSVWHLSHWRILKSACKIKRHWMTSSQYCKEQGRSKAAKWLIFPWIQSDKEISAQLRQFCFSYKGKHVHVTRQQNATI